MYQQHTALGKDDNTVKPLSFVSMGVFSLYTAQQKFSMDFIFVLILVRIRNDCFEVINKYGNP